MTACDAPEPEALYAQYGMELSMLASRALAKGIEPKKMVCVLVDVDDPVWGAFADSLGPRSEEHRMVRARGERPIRLGSFTSDLVPSIVEIDSSLSVGLWTEATHDVVRIVVMSAGRAIVRYLAPAGAAQPS